MSFSHYATKEEAKNMLLCMSKKLADKHEIVKIEHTWIDGRKEIRYCLIFSHKK